MHFATKTYVGCGIAHVTKCCADISASSIAAPDLHTLINKCKQKAESVINLKRPNTLATEGSNISVLKHRHVGARCLTRSQMHSAACAHMFCSGYGPPRLESPETITKTKLTVTTTEAVATNVCKVIPVTTVVHFVKLCFGHGDHVIQAGTSIAL